jgi:hypothetical protein
MNATVAARHEARRRAAYAVVAASVAARAPVSFSAIDATACAEFQSKWDGDPRRRVNWDWHGIAHHYQHRRWARLDLSIWSGSTLCGLAIGRFSRAETILQLNYVEGSPAPHPLRGEVLYLAVTYGIFLATAYGSTTFRATNPAAHVTAALTKLNPPFHFVARSRSAPYYPYCERSLP